MTPARNTRRAPVARSIPGHTHACSHSALAEVVAGHALDATKGAGLSHSDPARVPDTAAGTSSTREDGGVAGAPRVVLLGVAGGPAPTGGRAGIASVLIAGDGAYLVDAGRGALNQFMDAGLGLSALKGIFLTHMHQDHTSSYFDFLLLGNRIPRVYEEGFVSLTVCGPGPGAPPPFLPKVEQPYAPDDPYPGIVGLTEGSFRAHANALNNFLAVGAPDLRETVTLRELPPADVQASPADPAPSMTPFQVFEDHNVRVTATLVPHAGLYPSLGYRFDTDGGSVVFSGDTRLSRDNLVTLARGADLLVHEVYDREGMIDMGAPAQFVDTVFGGGHTEAEEVGLVAEDAGVEQLVLNHLLPAEAALVPTERWLAKAQHGYHGKVVLGHDLLSLPVRAH